jgi:hypothetical protein
VDGGVDGGVEVGNGDGAFDDFLERLSVTPWEPWCFSPPLARIMEKAVPWWPRPPLPSNSGGGRIRWS